jgi:hypothetical protein
MSAVTWLPVGAVAPEKLREAHHQAHNAAQWLARVAHSYMQPQPEHAHTRLHWDAQRGALVTQDFLPKLTLDLRVANLTLQFREDGKAVPHVIEIDDRTPAEVEAWVLVELLHRRLDRDRFSKALPYAMPGLMTGDAIPYMSETLEAELAELAAWLANAASVLAHLAEEYLPAAPGASAVWCWPEIFHMALLLPARADEAVSGRMLRAGLALGDAHHVEPYFYVVLHDPEPLANACSGTILTAATLASSASPADGVLEFLRKEIAMHRSL